jgi:hypothetical protein
MCAAAHRTKHTFEPFFAWTLKNWKATHISLCLPHAQIPFSDAPRNLWPMFGAMTRYPLENFTL